MDRSVSVHSNCGFLLLSESCNLRCFHCYVSAEPGVGQHMPLSVVEAAFALLQSLDIHDIRLTGGEPTIHPQFHRVIEMAAHRKIHLGLVSNGIRLLRQKWGKEVFKQLSRCWISIYGLVPSSHESVGGKAVRSIQEILEQVGRLTQEGHWIGVSALVNVGEGGRVSDLMTAAISSGVTRLRLLPIQPDGRVLSHAPLNWTHWPEEVKRVVYMMKEHPRAQEFDVLTINDPFDLADRFHDSSSSCLLKRRQMWSIVPSGDVYPCCFTVYRPALRLGNILDSGIERRLRGFHEGANADVSCHGLTRLFWQGANPRLVTCPISAIDPRRGRTDA